LSDDRGCFVKTFHFKEFLKNGIDFSPKEEFFSISKKGVLRGMHFQIPPQDHSKLVYCTTGEVLDVIIDLRKGPGYGKVISLQLDSIKKNMLFVPRGCAHGFLTISDSATVSYLTDHEYCAELDRGIHWDSISFEWPSFPYIVSSRDSSHQKLTEFNSPF
jgi:dTDP-4-dehydrorhamnose 3,5-epimerase